MTPCLSLRCLSLPCPALCRLVPVIAAFAFAALLAPLLATEAGAAPVPPHHDADVDYDPVTRRLSVIDRIGVEGRDRIVLSFAPWLNLIETRIDRKPAATVPAAKGLALALPGTGGHVIEIRLEGVVPELAGGRSRGGGAGGGAGSDGLYLPGHTDWLPATGDETITYELRTRMTLPFRAVATGRLVNDGDDGKAHRATITAERPMEPPSLFAGPYRIAEAMAGPVRIRTYFHDELAGLAKDFLERTAQFLDRYGAGIGAYPYRDFHVISAPLPVGLGFPSLTYVGRRVLPLPFMRAGSLAHEILHSWWGNAVGVDYARGNWAEGLTTYMADYALAVDRGPETARQMRLGWLRDFAALPPDRDHPVVAFTGKHHQAAQVIGYNKVAFIFHMLRRDVGNAAFGAALRRFWRDKRFKVAGWRDIEAVFADQAGRDLSWFFEQWLRRPGAPRIELAGVDVEPGTGGVTGGGTGDWRVSVRLKQTGPYYRIKIPIVIDTQSGPTRVTTEMAGADHTAVLQTGTRPLRVSVDPEFDLFRALLPGESPPILRDVTLASTAFTAIVTPDPGVRRLGETLAARMLDTKPRILPPGELPPDDLPGLIIGLEKDVDQTLKGLGLAPPLSLPRALEGGSARAWAGRRANGTPVIIVSATDETALEAVLRPLPHYGRRSFVVFDGRRAIRKGVWPPGETPLSRSLDSR